MRARAHVFVRARDDGNAGVRVCEPGIWERGGEICLALGFSGRRRAGVFLAFFYSNPPTFFFCPFVYLFVFFSSDEAPRFFFFMWLPKAMAVLKAKRIL